MQSKEEILEKLKEVLQELFEVAIFRTSTWRGASEFRRIRDDVAG